MDGAAQEPSQQRGRAWAEPCGGTRCLDLVDRTGLALRGRIFGQLLLRRSRWLEHPDHLHLVGPGFGCSRGCTRQVCPCGRLRVDGNRVAEDCVYVLAEPPSYKSIRSVHFDDGETRIQKLAGQTGPIGACAFNRVDGVGAKLLAPYDQIFISLVPPARWPAVR
jgi:hypothetical protein